MRLYKSLSYFSLAALLGVSLADVEITGVNKLPVSTPSRLDVLKTKKFPSLFNAKVDIDFASNTYEISTLLLPSSDEEGIPFSVSYTSSLVDIGDISQYIIKAGEDEAISADDFEVDGWQMNFLPLQVDKDAPSLAMKFVAVSPEGLHYYNNPNMPCSTGRGGGISCRMQTVPLRSVGEKLQEQVPVEESESVEEDQVEEE